jgi:hypothetical protein
VSIDNHFAIDSHFFDLDDRVEVWNIDVDKVYCRFVEPYFASMFFDGPSPEAWRTKEEALAKLAEQSKAEY